MPEYIDVTNLSSRVYITVDLDSEELLRKLDSSAFGQEIVVVSFTRADPKRPGKKKRHSFCIDVRGFYDQSKPKLRIVSITERKDISKDFRITPWVEER